jgi:uncharacterized membrane protein
MAALADTPAGGVRPMRPGRDMRAYARGTQLRLIAGGLFLALVVGSLLIRLVYGPTAGRSALICTTLALLPLGLIWGFLLLAGWIARRAGRE